MHLPTLLEQYDDSDGEAAPAANGDSATAPSEVVPAVAAPPEPEPTGTEGEGLAAPLSWPRWAGLLLGLAGTLSVPGYCLLWAVHRPPPLTPTLVHHTAMPAVETPWGPEPGQHLSRTFIDSFKWRVLGHTRAASNASVAPRDVRPFQDFPDSSAWATVRWDAPSHTITATLVHRRLATNASTVPHFGLVQRYALDSRCFLDHIPGSQRCPPGGDRWRIVFTEHIPRVVDAVGQSADRTLLFVVGHRVLPRRQRHRRWLRLYSAMPLPALHRLGPCRQQLPYAARTLSSLSCEIPLEGALPILALDYDPHTGCLQYSQDEDVYTFRSLCFSVLATGEVRWGPGPVGPFLDRRAPLSDLHSLHSYQAGAGSGVVGVRLTACPPRRLQLSTFHSHPRPGAPEGRRPPPRCVRRPRTAANTSAGGCAAAGAWRWAAAEAVVAVPLRDGEGGAAPGPVPAVQSADRRVVALFHQERLVIVDLHELFHLGGAAAGGHPSGVSPVEVVEEAPGEEGGEVGLLALFGLGGQPPPAPGHAAPRLAVDPAATMVAVARGPHAHVFAKVESPETEHVHPDDPSLGPAWMLELKVSSHPDWGPPKAISDVVFASHEGAGHLVVLFSDGLLASYNLQATQTVDAVLAVLLQQYQLASCLLLGVMLLLWSGALSSITALLRPATPGLPTPTPQLRTTGGSMRPDSSITRRPQPTEHPGGEGDADGEEGRREAGGANPCPPPPAGLDGTAAPSSRPPACATVVSGGAPALATTADRRPRTSLSGPRPHRKSGTRAHHPESS